MKCDLARAKEIVALISSKPLRSSFVNETGELGSIVKEVLISDKERKSEVEIRELIENMAILFTLNISDKNAETDIVMIFVTLGNHISYYGHENNKTIQKIKTMYQEIAEREIYLNKQLEEIGFMIRRPSELFPLLRKAIYRMRPDELPECPDIVERYSPEMCEVE